MIGGGAEGWLRGQRANLRVPASPGPSAGRSSLGPPVFFIFVTSCLWSGAVLIVSKLRLHRSFIKNS
jgi:hypothetical protein